MNFVLIVLLGYLIGSVPVSYFTGKYIGKVDITKHGSGNSGSTNVLRTAGKKAGIIALLGDLLKGVLAATVGLYLAGTTGLILAGSAAVIGHCFPLIMKFRKGGKGVATTAGILLVLSPLSLLILTSIFLLVFKLRGIVSLASVSVAALVPVVLFFLGQPVEVLVFGLFIGCLVIYRHKANIERLIKGEEKRIKL